MNKLHNMTHKDEPIYSNLTSKSCYMASIDCRTENDNCFNPSGFPSNVPSGNGSNITNFNESVQDTEGGCTLTIRTWTVIAGPCPCSELGADDGGDPSQCGYYEQGIFTPWGCKGWAASLPYPPYYLMSEWSLYPC